MVSTVLKKIKTMGMWQSNSPLILSLEEVYVVTKNKDRYGRTLGITYTLPDSVCLNEALLSAGLAWHYKCFDKNEAWATWNTGQEKQSRALTIA